MHPPDTSVSVAVGHGAILQNLLVFIPCYNEANAVADVLEQAGACGLEHILVIDDGSTDATYAVARGGSEVVRLIKKIWHWRGCADRHQICRA